MSFWRQVRHGLRVLLHRGAADQDLDDEAAAYLEELVASLRQQGLSAAEASRAARLQMGSALSLREQVRDGGWENRIAGIAGDLRHAIRRLSRCPQFTSAAVLTLGLGLGAAATLYAVIDAVLLRPLPYPDSGRLIALHHAAPGVRLPDLRLSPSLYLTYLEESRVFSGLAMWNGGRATVTGAGQPEVRTLFVTVPFLEVLGVQPALGRGFSAADGDWRAPRTVVLADGYWRQRFGASPAVLGRRILIDGNAHKVVGVLPRSFEFLDEKFSLLVPRRLVRSEVRLIQFSEDGIARLKPGVTLQQANADLARCLALAPGKFPMNPGMSANAFREARLTPQLHWLKDDLVGDTRRILWTLMAGVAILLLIACANVANLLLVRADGRRHELAVRSALGAGSGRIARELLAESTIVGLGGGSAGLVLCYAALRWVVSTAMPYVPRLDHASVQPGTLLLTFAASLCAGILFGLAPVWRYARPRLAGTLGGAGGRSATGGKERRHTQRMLVVVQVLLATVLLVGSGLMLRTMAALRHVDPGFTRPHEVQLVRISIPPSQVADPAAVLQMEETVLKRFAEIPGVSAVAISNSAPMQGNAGDPVFTNADEPAGGKVPPVRNTRFVSPSFFAAIGSRLIAGRDITWSEVHEGAPVALVSENMAREVWGTPQAALGKPLRASLTHEWRQVVGVAADLHDDGLSRKAPAIVYWPLLEMDKARAIRVPRNVDLMIRTPRAGSTELIRELEQALHGVNGNLPLANVRTLGDIYERSLARSSFALLLLAIAGGMALLLGVVGIHGVVAYSVAQRRRDIGIRIALGSSPSAVTRLFVLEALVLAALGAVLGVAVAAAATQLMRGVLYGVSPNDPLTFAAVVCIVVPATAAAGWLPARKAAAVDPVSVVLSAS